MITFYPGPSKLYPKIETYLQDGFRSGILQMNHRSEGFMDMLKECIGLLKKKLNIPAEYHVYFTSSATECWEIITQSLVAESSFHVFNGTFGQKWFEYTQKLKPMAQSLHFEINSLPNLPANINSEVICFTQNETSNGTQLLPPYWRRTGDGLIAFDVTSSLGGIELDWKSGDVWLASVQKCLGLPAGMGIMICSPKALKKAEEINDRKYYNSLLFIHKNFEKYQTHYTPNILNIYLLLRVLQDVENIETVGQKIKERAKNLYNFIENETDWQLIVQNKEVRSDTVLAIEGGTDAIKAIKQKAKQNNITLGNGYGAWKNTSFRIANFPAIEDWEFEELKEILI
ncbi:MAG: aminotransferase class V-fold PLP-dependent enzyme [Spirosomataceae bacterium]